MDTQTIQNGIPVINFLAKPGKTSISPELEPAESAKNINTENKTDIEITEKDVDPKADFNRTYANFSIYKPTGYVVVKIIDAETGEVIAQHPPNAAKDALESIKKNDKDFNRFA